MTSNIKVLRLRVTGGIVERKLIVGAQGDHKIGLLS